MDTIKRKDLMETIKATEGKKITIVFIKKDGTVRIMKCVYGIRKEDSKGMNYDAEAKGLISVFDIEKQEYRVVPIATTRKLVIEDKVFNIIDREGLRRRNEK
jgi:hypothetical protein